MRVKVSLSTESAFNEEGLVSTVKIFCSLQAGEVHMYVPYPFICRQASTAKNDSKWPLADCALDNLSLNKKRKRKADGS